MPDSQPPTNCTSSHPIYRIEGLDDLFHDIGKDDQKEHFPAGSTMVLSGPPGSGKTTFALNLVRSAMRDNDGNPKNIVYYISTEVDRDRLKRMYESRGWFYEPREKSDDQERDELFRHPLPDNDAGLVVIKPPLEIDRPVKSSEELVNHIVRQIAIQPRPKVGQFVFIVVDSVTALFKDSASAGDTRRQVHELVTRLREQFAPSGDEPTSLGMILLLSELGPDNIDNPGMETYVADFVFNLGFKSLTMGVRLRTLEITKSQGINMKMGTHTWHILTRESINRLISGESLQMAVFEKVSEVENFRLSNKQLFSRKGNKSQKWCTMVIAARPEFQPVTPLLHSNPAGEKSGWKTEPSGIQGLDQMLQADPSYWFESRDSSLGRAEKAIKPGNVTMLVGEAGTGKTSLCYHVIAKHLADNPNSQTLLVGFEHDFRDSFNQFAIKYPKPSTKPGNKAFLNRRDCRRCETVFRTRSGLHFNLFLLELKAWLEANKHRPKRIAIDGISNLGATNTRQTFSQMLDALINLFAEHNINHPNNPVCVFLTYESAQTESMFDSDVFRLPADNIIMLQHKVIEDQRRTAVSIIKSAHPDHDTMVRELHLDHDDPGNTCIHSGFDAYSGLLSGHLQKARVTAVQNSRMAVREG